MVELFNQLIVKVKMLGRTLCNCVFCVYYVQDYRKGHMQGLIHSVTDEITRIVIHGLFKDLKFKILSRLGNFDTMPF